MKVKSSGDFVINITLNCRVCKFHEMYYFDGQNLLERRDNLTKYRSKARYHTQTTGHVVEVYIEHFCVYKPVEVMK